MMRYTLTSFNSFKQVSSPKFERPFITILVIMLAIAILALIIVPWQQSIPGTGEVTVFTPSSRPQTIHSQIDGRISKWHVIEGEWVKAGQLLVELEEVSSAYLDNRQSHRLKEQREALQQQLKVVSDLNILLNQQINTQKTLQKNAVPAAQLKQLQASEKSLAAEQALAAAKQNLLTAQLNFDRLTTLYEKGLRSKRDLELATLDYENAQSQKRSAEAQLEVIQQEVNIAGFERGKIAAETLSKQQDVQAKLAESLQKKASLVKEIAALDIQINNLSGRIDQRKIKAPIAGQVVQVLAAGPGETISAKMPLMTINPKTNDQAVALYVADWDAPLISVGRPVRLQFAGWPAIQFTGWPSVAVGTFPGKVAVIDAVANEQNQYRLLIVPDKERIAETSDHQWPSSQYLRPGSQVNGWVMLDTVPLGYELWRIFNGFPPTIKKPDLKDSGLKKIKKKPGF